MKKYFFLFGFTTLAFSFLIQAKNAGNDTLPKKHGQLMAKANSFFSTYKSGIDAQVKRTERRASKPGQGIAGAMSQIIMYREDSIFYQKIIQKGDSLSVLLKEHDEILLTQEKGELIEKFLIESAKNIDKVNWVITYAKDLQKQVDKRLKNLYKVLKEMRDDLAKQESRQERKKQKK